MPVYHADVYRIASFSEFDDLDLPSLAEEGVLMVEWGNVVSSVLPMDHLVVEIDPVSETNRTIRFTPEGAWCSRPLNGLVV